MPPAAELVRDIQRAVQEDGPERVSILILDQRL